MTEQEMFKTANKIRLNEEKVSKNTHITGSGKYNDDPVIKQYLSQQKNIKIKEDATMENESKENNAINTEVDNDDTSSITGVIGIGAAGGNCVDLAKKDGFITMAVNGSTEDLKNIIVDNKFIISGNGSGKERKRAKEKFIPESERFIKEVQTLMETCKNIVVIHSAGGGTGSGDGPMVSKFLQVNFKKKNIFDICILGSIEEDIKSHQNSQACMKELSDANINYLLFDNEKAYKLSQSPDDIYSIVNKEILSTIHAIARTYVEDNTRSNGDKTDMQKLYMDNKRMIIVSGMFDTKISSKPDYDNQILEALNNTTQIDTEGSKIMSYGFFLNVPNSLYRDIDPNFRKLQSVLGEPYETYKNFSIRTSDNGPDFTIFLTGLDDATDRYSVINKRIAEFNERKISSKKISDIQDVTINPRKATAEIISTEIDAEPEKNTDKNDIDLSILDKFMK